MAISTHTKLLASCLLPLFLLGSGQGLREARAQQVTLRAPRQSASNQFFSHLGTRMHFRQSSPNGHFFFRQGGLGALPPFGGFDPARASHLGLGARRGNTSWGLGISMAQGASQTRTTLVPSLTMPSGGFGTLFSGQMRPFVTGIVPVVRGAPVACSPLSAKLATLRQRQLLQALQDRDEETEASPSGDTPPQAPRPSRPRPDDPPLVLRGSSD